MPQSKCRRSPNGCSKNQKKCLTDFDGTPRCRRRKSRKSRKSGGRRSSGGRRRRSRKSRKSGRRRSARHGYNSTGSAGQPRLPSLRQQFLDYSDTAKAEIVYNRKSRGRKSRKSSRKSRNQALTQRQSWIDSMYNKGITGLKRFPNFSKLPRDATMEDRNKFLDMQNKAGAIYNLAVYDNKFNTDLFNSFQYTVMNKFAGEPGTVRKQATTIVFLLGRKILGQSGVGQGMTYNLQGQRDFLNRYYGPRAPVSAARAAPWNLGHFGGQLNGF